MKIIVCLKEIIDPALGLDTGLRHRPVFQQGLPTRLNPADAAALAMALKLKRPGDFFTLVSIGPERVESYLQDGLALGADRAILVTEETASELTPHRKAVILARIVLLYPPDIILLGTRSLDTGRGQVGPFLAALMGWPCLGNIVSFELNEARNLITALKDIGRGRRERVACNLPAVITVRGEGKLPYASLDALVAARQGAIIRLASSDLGLPPWRTADEPVKFGHPAFPRPHPIKVPPLDSSLPAFERILQLISSGISRRQGHIFTGSPDEVAERLFQVLKEAGLPPPAGKV